jgi:predicted component of type VI protein secretion system
MHMPFLEVIQEDSRARFQFERDEATVGRDAENDIVLADSSVSSRHCAVVRAGDGYILKDLDSTNGTLLNGELIKEAPLRAGDSFIVGGVAEIIFNATEPQLAPAEQPFSDEEIAGIPAIAGLMPVPPGFEVCRGRSGVRLAFLAAAGLLVLVAGLWFLTRLYT